MANTPTSKVIFGTETLIDLTGDTAEAGDVLLGKSFHLPSGAQGTGTLNPALKEDIAGVESSSIASVAHASGTYLYYNNVLYKATADIAQGDSIVTSGASQNVELVTVGGELVTLNTSLANLAQKVSGSDDEYSSLINYSIGNYVIHDNILWRCITACSAASWSVNQSCFESTTLTKAVTELNQNLTNLSADTSLQIIPISQVQTSSYATVTNTIYTEHSPLKLRNFYFQFDNASSYRYCEIAVNNVTKYRFGSQSPVANTPTSFTVTLLLKENDIVKLSTQTANASTTTGIISCS